MKSWHFGPLVDSQPSVIVETDSGTTMLVVDYDDGANRFDGGAMFTIVSGPEVDHDTLEELATDMCCLEASQHGPCRTRFYRKGAA